MATSWRPEYDEYLRDESRYIGTADSISFPRAETEVVDLINENRARGSVITIQGARTGIAAGAVPHGGHILNLSRMKAIGHIRRDERAGEYSLTVQPGALLSDVRETIDGHGLFFPPDPTETSASIGGMVACNASGALTFHYGPTRNWVNSIRIVLADGDAIRIRRGEIRAQGRSFSLVTKGGRVISGSVPAYAMPSVKSAAGYYAADGMDMLDLFIGMEGTLGVITEIELRLIPTPKAINGLTIFLSSEEAALKSVRILRGEAVEGFDRISSPPAAIEFFNSDSLNLLRKMKSNYSAFEKIPTLKPSFHTALYTEFHGETDEHLEEAVIGVMEALAGLGVSDENTWFATTERELAPLKAFRHATPEAVNLLIDERKRTCPELTKLGTDMSVPDEHLESAMAMYNDALKESGLESVVFGHIGNNHVHVNILPNSTEEYELGKSMYLSWAKRIVDIGGSVSAEHGIGKLKAPFLELMYGRDAIDQMRALKALFDPDMILNPGNLFS
ncbi:MAG: FAD-binding oxidoreductase [Armatimonadetes bacterium]|nr:FAD-binding oxidoreductase [Armatimonadota bacterium]